MLANLALEEGEEKLRQVVDSIPLDPEMLRNCLTEFSAVWAYNPKYDIFWRTIGNLSRS
jgi:hypothetical protein